METSAPTYPSLLDQFLQLASGGCPDIQSVQECCDSIPESLIQTIWREQILRGDKLQTLCGQRVEVVDPGRYQTGGPGPDFRSAHLILDGKEIEGDIEIHVDAQDWDRHGHDQDFEYNGVILHVALRTNQSRSRDPIQNGRFIPRLILEPWLDPDLPGALAAARELLLSETDTPLAQAGGHGSACRLAVNQLGPPNVRRLLARAADERLKRRIERLRTLGRGMDQPQLLHQAILTGLGQRGAKTLYFLLSRRMPLDDLATVACDVHPCDQALAIESALLGVAGLLPDPSDQRVLADESANQHHDSLRGHWAQYRGWLSNRILPPTRRWLSQVRPPAFPCRRIAAYAALVAQAPKPDQFAEGVLKRFRTLAAGRPCTAKDWKKVVATATNWFVVNEHPYWDRHCTWGGKALPHRLALLGQDQAESLTFNALLPWALLQTEHQGDADLSLFLRDLHTQFPALASNSITRYMETRLFGDKVPPEIPLKLERYRQGLIQLFSDCCDHPAFRTCGLNRP